MTSTLRALVGCLVRGLRTSASRRVWRSSPAVGPNFSFEAHHIYRDIQTQPIIESHELHFDILSDHHRILVTEEARL